MYVSAIPKSISFAVISLSLSLLSPIVNEGLPLNIVPTVIAIEVTRAYKVKFANAEVAELPLVKLTDIDLASTVLVSSVVTVCQALLV